MPMSGCPPGAAIPCTAMRLHTREWGDGDRVAVLVHGMMGESRQFWEVGPKLAQRGFRAVAVDLPGHGLSGPCTSGGLSAFAAAMTDSVPAAPSLVIGHSLGAMVLAQALPVLRPERAVYVDVPFEPLGVGTEPLTASALTREFEGAKARRTVDRLAESRPWWTDGDRAVEAEAARLFHVPTAVALDLAEVDPAAAYPPPTNIPSLIIHAEPSTFVSTERAQELREMGFSVRAVPGAGHSVWYGFLDLFMSELDSWLSEPSVK